MRLRKEQLGEADADEQAEEAKEEQLEEAEKKNSEWEQKYNDNDAMWRKKYIDRFNGKVEDIPEVRQNLEAERSSNITIEDLFTAKE